MNYTDFIKKLDKTLEECFKTQIEDICCQKGCSFCCEKGDYPISDVELEYLMIGYAQLSSEIKILVQENIKSMQKGEQCPFLINKECSIYKHRPIICRVHGLAYLCSESKVKLPYCVNLGKNFSKNYNNGEVFTSPIKINLDTPNLLKEFGYNEIRNLYDWIKK